MDLYSEHSAASRPKFIQLVEFQQDLFALDSEGKVWERSLVWDEEARGNMPAWFPAEWPIKELEHAALGSNRSGIPESARF
jgi:hypothetical protein